MQLAPHGQQLPVQIVGSTKFGRYAKMSVEQTYNMFVENGTGAPWLIPYAGHKKLASIQDAGSGREIFGSIRLNALITVVNNFVYLTNASYSQNGVTKIGEIETSNGDVFIAENNGSQIAICDKKNIYIYNYNTGSFTKATLDTGFIPVHISFQDGYFIAAMQNIVNNASWALSALNNGLSWPTTGAYRGGFQTKPNNCVACVPVPGKGGALLVFGSTVTELWQDLGLQLFPYQRASGFNIDYGCLNSATIAVSDTFVVWLGVNEKSGPAILMSSGGQPQQISTDGINYRLANLVHPEVSYGFLFKQDGHLFYQLTFPHQDDDVTYMYDFNTQLFFGLTDEFRGCHIAKRVAYYNNSYYFLAFENGYLYEMNSKYTTYNGEEIPRIRTTDTIRLPGNTRFIANSLNFTLEQGEAPIINPDRDVQHQEEEKIARIDLSVSYDGGVTFTNSMHYQMNEVGKRKNKLIFWGLGNSNEMTIQLRFWGTNRFVASDGLLNIYQ